MLTSGMLVPRRSQHSRRALGRRNVDEGAIGLVLDDAPPVWWVASSGDALPGLGLAVRGEAVEVVVTVLEDGLEVDRLGFAHRLFPM